MVTCEKNILVSQKNPQLWVDQPAWVADMLLGVLHGEVSERVTLVTVQTILHLHGMSRYGDGSINRSRDKGSGGLSHLLML